MQHRLRDQIGQYPPQYWLLILGSLISTTGGAMVWPFLTIYLRERLDIPMAVVSLLLTANSIAGVLSSFIAGPVADRFGRRWIMIISLTAGAGYYVCMSQAESLPAFAVLVFLGGAFNVLYPIGANAMIADLVSTEQRLDAYSLARVVHNVGVAVGPAVGGFMAAMSYSFTFLTAAACFGAYALIIFIFIRETLPSRVKLQAVETKPVERLGYGRVLRDPQFMSFVGLFTMTMMSAAVMFMLLSVYLKENFAIGENQYGFIVTANALMCIFVQYFITRMTRAKKAYPVLGLGALFYGVGVGSVALGSTFTHFLISMIVMTMGELIMTPTATSLAANLAPVDMRGRYMSLYNLSWPIGSGIGTVVAGWLNDAIAPVAMWYAGFTFATLAAAGFAFLAARQKKKAGVQPASSPGD